MDEESGQEERGKRNGFVDCFAICFVMKLNSEILFQINN